MPFDATGFQDDAAIYRERRARAAALWRARSRRGFSLRVWVSPERGSACALGWLAAAGVDGWRLVEDADGGLEPRWAGGRPGASPFEHAAQYFGLTAARAHLMFQHGEGLRRPWWRPTRRLRRNRSCPWWSTNGWGLLHEFVETARAADVARTLLALPVTTEPAGRAAAPAAAPAAAEARPGTARGAAGFGSAGP